MDMDALRVGAGRKPIRRTRRGRVRGRARVCASRERAEKRDTRSPPTETVPDDTSELTKLQTRNVKDQDDVACERRVKSHAHIDARP